MKGISPKNNRNISERRLALREMYWEPIKRKLQKACKQRGEAKRIARFLGVHSSQIHRFECPVCEHNQEPAFSTGMGILLYFAMKELVPFTINQWSETSHIHPLCEVGLHCTQNHGPLNKMIIGKENLMVCNDCLKAEEVIAKELGIKLQVCKPPQPKTKTMRGRKSAFDNGWDDAKAGVNRIHLYETKKGRESYMRGRKACRTGTIV